MADPITIGTIAKKAGEKLIFDVLTEPENIIKYIFAIIGIILGLLLFIVLPVIIIVSIPIILIGNANLPSDMTEKQLDTIAMYQAAPIQINKQAMDWVEGQKTNADKYVTDINFDLTWQMIIAVDAVQLNQDFSKANKTDILNLGNKFISKNVNTSTYKVNETYTEIILDEYGVPRSVAKTRTVTKKKKTITIKTKTMEEVLNELRFSAEQKSVVENMYKTLIVDVEGNLNKYDLDVSDLKEYPPGNAEIPYYNQADKRWGNYNYGKTGTIKSSGCGPTCLSMVVAGLTGRFDVNPKTVADWSYKNGHRCEGSGSYWSLMTAGGNNYGLNVEAVSRRNPKRIVEALSKGYPVIASMGPGHFTKGGHFIVLRGLTEDGKILVYDPASLSRSEKSWDISIIMSESSTLGGVDGYPFWVFTNKGVVF